MGDTRVAALLAEVGVPRDVEVEIDGRDPILAARFPVGEAAAVAVGAGAVSVSLCRTGMWIRSLGADLDPTAAAGLDDWRSRTVETATMFGRVRHLRPVAEMSRTGPRWDLPPAPIGTHAAEWSDG